MSLFVYDVINWAYISEQFICVISLHAEFNYSLLFLSLYFCVFVCVCFMFVLFCLSIFFLLCSMGQVA